MTPDTRGEDYAARLSSLSGARWKQVLDVQAPYRWNLRRLKLGTTLDVGCGIGRNLVSLDAGSVGVDHNATSVQLARDRGLEAYTATEFPDTPAAERRFDSLLLAHVAEHMSHREAVGLVSSYTRFLRPGATLAVICPQERGYATDPTHVRFTDFHDIERLCSELGATVQRRMSFPFPRPVGKVFPYNEFVVTARLPS